MDYKEVKETIRSIKKAIKNGDYTVCNEEPNNIKRCMAPNGRTFYKVFDMDDARSSTLFGSCEVEVCGYSFSCYWGEKGWGEDDVESDFFDELDDCYELKNGSCVYKEDIIEEITDEFDKREDIYFGTYMEMDDQMWIYSKINNLSKPEYYWYEDSDCPIDIDDDWCDFSSPENHNFGVVEFDGNKYYLVEDPNERSLDAVHGVRSDAEPDDSAQYATVTMRLECKDGEFSAISIEDSEDMYDACEKYIL